MLTTDIPVQDDRSSDPQQAAWVLANIENALDFQYKSNMSEASKTTICLDAFLWVPYLEWFIVFRNEIT